MPDAKHTPGPWEVGVYPPRGVQVEAFTREGEMAGNRTLRLLVESENIEADARLIAAAPDMLAALDEAFNALAFCALPADGCDDAQALAEAQKTIRAAIAKAKGGPDA